MSHEIAGARAQAHDGRLGVRYGVDSVGGLQWRCVFTVLRRLRVVLEAELSTALNVEIDRLYSALPSVGVVPRSCLGGDPPAVTHLCVLWRRPGHLERGRNIVARRAVAHTHVVPGPGDVGFRHEVAGLIAENLQNCVASRLRPRLLEKIVTLFYDDSERALGAITLRASPLCSIANLLRSIGCQVARLFVLKHFVERDRPRGSRGLCDGAAHRQGGEHRGHSGNDRRARRALPCFGLSAADPTRTDEAGHV